MKISVNYDDKLLLEEVYYPIALKTNNGEEMSICMRDSGYEIIYFGDVYVFCNGQFEKLTKPKFVNNDLLEQNITNNGN